MLPLPLVAPVKLVSGKQVLQQVLSKIPAAHIMSAAQPAAT